MVQPDQVASETITMIDAEGNITEDPQRAVRGEITSTLPDGTIESTIFEVEASGPVSSS